MSVTRGHVAARKSRDAFTVFIPEIEFGGEKVILGVKQKLYTYYNVISVLPYSTCNVHGCCAFILLSVSFVFVCLL